VGSYLADQLLVPLALAGRGSYRTVAPTPHTLTNADVIGRFLDVPIAFTRVDEDVTDVTVGTSPEEAS
jgi:RNA 3'-terminal phosphate cyclase (ATP)